MVHRRACCRPAMCYDGGKFVTEKSEVVLQSLGELCAAAAEAVCCVMVCCLSVLASPGLGRALIAG